MTALDLSTLDLSALDRYRPIVDDWPAFCAALQRPLPVCIWTNTLRATPPEVSAWLARDGFAPVPTTWYPGAFRLSAAARPAQHAAYSMGLFHIQEEASLLPPVLLGAQPGETILDLCAAPGGKTAQIAVDLQNTGTVVANDRYSGRLHVLRTLMDRLGLCNVSTTVCDGTRYPVPNALFDRVLVDVPCSCEGTSRKHPRVLRKASREQSLRMAAVQVDLLQQAIACCKPGGHVVYATCTYAPEENEAVVDAVLAAYPDAIRLQTPVLKNLVTTPGLTQWEDQSFQPSLSQTRRLWPHHQDTGGFFVALLQKTT